VRFGCGQRPAIREVIAGSSDTRRRFGGFRDAGSKGVPHDPSHQFVTS
jgi:hypothetical protein